MTQTSILYVSETKRQAETISYFGDFRDELAVGETLTSYTVTITCISGIDTNPSAMLYGGIDLHNNSTVIEQRIKQGVIGAIYDILFTVGTSLSNTYQKVTRLVILPNNITANQSHTTWWLTSWNYPYNAGDSMQGFSAFSGGNNLWLQPYFFDGAITSVSIQGGNLSVGSVFYTCVPDSMKGSSTILSGTLTLVLITYTCVPDSMKGNTAIISGNLFQGMVFYTTPPDAIKGNVSILSGALI